MGVRLLDLLKRIQFHSASDYDECPECGRNQYDTPKNTHNPGCELKAAIDHMEPDLKAFFVPEDF